MPTKSQVNLASFPQPEWNNATSLERAFQRVAMVSTKPESSDAYNEVLYAVGNNHAGTYYPVVLAAAPLIEQILREGTEWSQHTVLEALIDLCGSFQPEPGYELFQAPLEQEPKPLAILLKESVSTLEPLVDPIASG